MEEEKTVVMVVTVAGDGTHGHVDGNYSNSKFNYPSGVAIDKDGNIIVVEDNNHRIRKIDTNGIVTTIAGDGSKGHVDGNYSNSKFNHPFGVAIDKDGNIIVADRINNRIRKIDTKGIVTTIGGDGTRGHVDGNYSNSKFNSPYGVAIDKDGNIIVADNWNHRIRKIDTKGIVSTIGGDGSIGHVDGNYSISKFNFPSGVAIDKDGNIIVADCSNHRIRKIDTKGIVTTIAGDGSKGHVDGNYSNSKFNCPCGVAIDKDGNIIVADNGNNRIRKIDTKGIVTTIAGDGTSGYKNGQNLCSKFNSPHGLAIDYDGNIIVADSYNNTIRKIIFNGKLNLIIHSARIKHEFSICSFLKNIHENPQYHDFVIEFNDQSMKLHKAIISLQCPQMISSNNRNIPMNIFKQISQFIYFNHFECFDHFITIQLLVASKSFQIKQLEQLCQKQLFQSFTKENIFDILVECDKLNLQQEKEWCLLFIRKNNIKPTSSDIISKMKPDLILLLMSETSTNSNIPSPPNFNIKLKSFVEMMEELFDNKEYVDFTLIVDKTKLTIHKFILAPKWKFFSKLLDQNKEKHEVIHETPIPIDTLKKLIYYFYVGSVKSMSLRDCVWIFGLCDFYELQQEIELAEYCQCVIDMCVNSTNALEVLDIAIKLNNKYLKEKSISFSSSIPTQQVVGLCVQLMERVDKLESFQKNFIEKFLNNK